MFSEQLAPVAMSLTIRTVVTYCTSLLGDLPHYSISCSDHTMTHKLSLCYSVRCRDTDIITATYTRARIHADSSVCVCVCGCVGVCVH